MKRRAIFIPVAAAGLAIAAWFMAAHVQLANYQRELLAEIRSRPDQFVYDRADLNRFAANCRIRYVSSILPLLKKPWRTDVRLYFHGSAYAVLNRKTGAWFLKWP